MLLSNDLSRPDMSVPISVTDRTPIMIPKAVRIDRVLLANTEDKDILKFSKEACHSKAFTFHYPVFFLFLILFWLDL